jgi:hypothetical protein
MTSVALNEPRPVDVAERPRPAVLGAEPVQRRERPGSTATLGAAVLGFFVVTLDAVVVNVALPSIRQDFAAGIMGLQWVVDGYTLMFAALLLWSGTLTDRVGARRVFGVGLGLFVAALGPAGSRPPCRRSSSPDSCRARQRR